MEDLIISGKKYKSRLILGTGKYKSFEETAQAIKAAEVEIVTVAVRRVNVTNPKEPMLVDFFTGLNWGFVVLFFKIKPFFRFVRFVSFLKFILFYICVVVFVQTNQTLLEKNYCH